MYYSRVLFAGVGSSPAGEPGSIPGLQMIKNLGEDDPHGRWRREKRVLQLLAARPSYCNWTHRGGAQNRFLAAETHILPPPVPLHQAALLGGACSLTSPMRHLFCRHIVAGSSASFRSICTWARSRHDEETLPIVMQSAPKNSAEVLSECRSRGHL